MKNPRPYMEWVLLAQRWDKVIDHASPISARTVQMLKDTPQKFPTLPEKA